MSFKLSSEVVTGGVQKKPARTQFALSGFRQEVAFRVFTFETSSVGTEKVQFFVRADLSLARRYGIQMQMLPLLCWELLERNEGSIERTFTYSEEEMSRHARVCRDELAASNLKKQTARRALVTKQPGVGWRTVAPQTLAAPQTFKA